MTDEQIDRLAEQIAERMASKLVQLLAEEQSYQPGPIGQAVDAIKARYEYAQRFPTTPIRVQSQHQEVA